MARFWISRIMLAYSMMLSFVLALSIPRPSLATLVQLWTQVTLLVVSGVCFTGLLLLKRRPRIGWRIAGVMGLIGTPMLCWTAWQLLQATRTGSTLRIASTLV